MARIHALATQDESRGGMALLSNFSREYRQFANPAPPSILENRPETNFLFLQWLIPRQSLLSQLIPRDVEQRGLKGRAANNAALTIQNSWHNLLRHVDLVMLHKALFLFHHAQTHPLILTCKAYSELLEKASTIILSLEADHYTLECWGLRRTDLSQQDVDAGWLKIIATQNVESVDVVWSDLLQYHTQISIRMSGYIKISWDNLSTTEWLAAGILSTKPEMARTSARLLRDYLVRRQSAEMRDFEKEFSADDSLMSQLDEFASQEPAMLVWRRNARWSELFLFLAVRFLSCGDTVLDCESIHARWKWLSELNRNLRFRLFAALLKLSYYTHKHGSLPALSDMYQCCLDALQAQALERAEARRNNTICSSMRSQYLWSTRFSIGPEFVDLIKERTSGATGAATAEQSWGTFLRLYLLTSGHDSYTRSPLCFTIPILRRCG